MSTLYYTTLQDTSSDFFQTGVTAGKHNIQLTFRWPTSIQEQVNIVEARWSQLAASDPILVDGNFVRDYDFVNYYAGIPADIETWLDEQTVLPNSLTTMTRAQKLAQIRRRKQECIGFASLRQSFTQMLCWEVTVAEREETNVCLLKTGGWNNNQSNTFSWAFYSDLTDVGKGDLGNTIMMVEVYDE